MTKALRIVLIYYVLGFALSYLSYKTVPHTYIHAPGLHHLLVFLMFFSSFTWGVVSFVNWRRNKSDKYEKWMSIFHSIPVTLFFIWLVLEVNNYP